LTDEEIEGLVGTMIDESVQYSTDELSDDRELATNYYHARPFGNEEEGRSQVVSTDVREAVAKVMPSLLRVFTGSERYVEFKPRGQGDEAQARQQTDYINHIITEDNPGFIELHSIFKDALIRKTGVAKWWVEEEERDESTEYTGLTEEQVLFLEEQPDVDINLTGAEAPVAEGMPLTYTAEVTKHYGLQKIIGWGAVPNEEIFWNRSARSFEDARIVVHVCEKRRDQLIAMGFSEDDLEGLEGETWPVNDTSGEGAARRQDQMMRNNFDDEQDAGTRPIIFAEAYVYLTVDGVNEAASLCKVQMAGSTWKLLDWEKVSHRPFALFCPDPEAHEMVGTSLADLVMDIQRIKSAILRGTLDSLSLSLYPATEVVEGMVNMQDAENTEIGRHIRVREPGQMREIAHRFVGRESLPVVQYYDEVVEQRTGLSRASQGLDADAMQSTTKAAVAATLSAAQQRLELLSRIFAETGMKALYKGLLRTVVENQNKARTIRLRGEWVEIDPRAWDSGMDVVVNVALGQGMTEEKVGILLGISAKQEQIIQQLGPTNPLVSVSQYSNTLKRLVELQGFKTPTEFFSTVTPEQEQQMAEQQAQQPQKPEPAEMVAQAELIKAQTAKVKQESDAQLAQAKLALERERIMLEDDRERDKAAAVMALKIEEMNAKHSVTVTREEIERRTTLERQRLDGDTRVKVANIQADATKERTSGSNGAA